METEEFYGNPLVDLPTLAQHISATEQLPVEVKLLDARVYPDGRVMLVRHTRRSRSSMSVANFVQKLRRDYPGLDFRVPAHGRTRLDTARGRLRGMGSRGIPVEIPAVCLLKNSVGTGSAGDKSIEPPATLSSAAK